MKALSTQELVSLWSGEKKFIIKNGKRFFAWQEDGKLCFRWGTMVVELTAAIFNTDNEDFLPELCRIVSLIFFWRG